MRSPNSQFYGDTLRANAEYCTLTWLHMSLLCKKLPITSFDNASTLHVASLKSTIWTFAFAGLHDAEYRKSMGAWLNFHWEEHSHISEASIFYLEIHLKQLVNGRRMRSCGNCSSEEDAHATVILPLKDTSQAGCLHLLTWAHSLHQSRLQPLGRRRPVRFDTDANRLEASEPAGQMELKKHRNDQKVRKQIWWLVIHNRGLAVHQFWFGSASALRPGCYQAEGCWSTPGCPQSISSYSQLRYDLTRRISLGSSLGSYTFCMRWASSGAGKMLAMCLIGRILMLASCVETAGKVSDHKHARPQLLFR